MITSSGKVAGVMMLALVAGALAAGGKGPELTGAVAMSSADVVAMLDPQTGRIREIETGPVGFLFPGPGYVLFAPDLVNGVTTVIDVRNGIVADRLAGVTLPRFGPWDDRYLIVSGALTIVSYPDRSLIMRMEGDFTRPWQVEIGPVGVSFLILERDPSGALGSILSAVDVGSRKVTARREFTEDLLRFAVVYEIGLITVADTTRGRIRFLDPATFFDVSELAVDGVTDLVALPESKDLLAVGAAAKVLHWRLKATDDGLTVKSRDPIDLPEPGVRMALSPTGDAVAVVTNQGLVAVIDPKRNAVVGSWQTGLAPRDLVWCDPGRAGPLLPTWSDRGGGPEGAKLDHGKE